MPEPLKYGKWYHVRNEYLVAGTPGFLDSNGPARGCNTNYQDVSISAKKDRVAQGTGVWRIIPASDSAAAKPKNFGEDVMIGDYFYLQNCYGDAGYMEVCGDCGACTSNRYDVSLNKVRHREGAGSKNAIWQFWVGHAGHSTKVSQSTSKARIAIVISWTSVDHIHRIFEMTFQPILRRPA